MTIKGKAVLESLGLSRQFVTELLPPFKCFFRARSPYWTPEDTVQLEHVLGGGALADSTRPFEVEIVNIRSIIVSVQPGLENRLDEMLMLPTLNRIPLSQYVCQHDEINGTHSHFGILILSGDGVRKGVRLFDSALADVVPTLLALSGCPVANDMDGLVIREAFEDAFMAQRPIQYIETYEDLDESYSPMLLDDQEQDAIEVRLQKLGYMA